MDSLHFCIAIVPLAVYLLMLGLLNLRRHPFVTTGARDAATLGIGVVGFVIAGPMELFFPEGAASQFGAWVWLSLIVFYGLCVSPSGSIDETATGGLQRFVGRVATDLEQDCVGVGSKKSLDRRCFGDSPIKNSYALGSG